MKIRRYLAKDMRQALRQVRDLQGEEAVILSSRRTPEGVEVVAAIDFDAQTVIADAQSAATDAFNNETGNFADYMQQAQYQTTSGPHAEQNISNELRTLRRMLETQLAALAWNDLSRRAPVHTELLKSLTQLGLAQSLAAELTAQVSPQLEFSAAMRAALALCEQRMQVASERWLDSGGMVALVGPTGVGKTTTLAKLAARWVMQHGTDDLVLVSADSVRIGAQDHIQTLGRLLGVPAYGVDHTGDLTSVLERISGYRLVLIDTAGYSQRDPRMTAELALLATSHPKLETTLVLAANTQAGVLQETLTRFTPAMVKTCVLTKLDEATSIGGSMTALIRSELPLMYISDGQRVPEDLLPARSHFLITRAMELARRSSACADEELLSMRFGGLAHGHV